MSLSKNISRKATKSTIFNIKGGGHLVKVIWSFSNRERGYLLTIYININIYIIVADFDSVFSILTNDK